MENLQIGEYVRTYNNGIKRIDTIFKDKTVNRYGKYLSSKGGETEYDIIKTTDIKLHSFNIIDLIEEGDFVNGSEVTFVCKKYLATYDSFDITNEDIETVITKEQYEEMVYRVMK